MRGIKIMCDIISGKRRGPEPQTESASETSRIVSRFLEDGKIKQLPVKETYRRYVLQYLASKFEAETEYTEGRVNAIIDEWHTFGDYFLLRRELINSGLMKRLPDGSKYWRESEGGFSGENTDDIEA
jgi:hypothetical protein